MAGVRWLLQVYVGYGKYTLRYATCTLRLVKLSADIFVRAVSRALVVAPRDCSAWTFYDRLACANDDA